MAAPLFSKAKSTVVLVLLCSLFWCGRSENYDPSENLKIPASEFVGSVRSTIGVVRQVISMVSEFAGAFGDFRLRNAVSDCLDLMDLSVDQLSFTLSASQNPNAKDNGTGNVGADMKTWLSGALTNQDTCREGFDGTNGIVKNLVAGSLDQITSLVYDILSNVKTTPPKGGSGRRTPGGGGRRKLLSGDKFPDWLRPRYRELLQAANGVVADVVVAADGTGNFSTIEEAVRGAPGRPFVFRAAVLGDGFFAQSLGFRNTAGPEKHQAVALRVQADRSIFLNCRMEGYQDTLYAQTHRHFYRSCYITGTVDFIFGDAAAVFQNCMIYVRRPLDNQQTIVTAQGRIDRRETTGIVLQNCRILADDRLEPEKARFRSYLGRPWKEYSRTVVMESEIGDFIHPEGWMEWEGDFALKTLYYAEFGNKGKGADTAARVKWAGYRKIGREEALGYTVGPFIQGEAWLKSPDFPVRFGMFT